MPGTDGPALKQRLHDDLTAAIRSRDEVRSGTLRLALAAIATEEVAGTSARQLSDDEVMALLTREAKKRREAIAAYSEAGRPDRAAAEQAELDILGEYLPAALTPDELDRIVSAAVAEVLAGGTPPGKAMGAVMRIVTPQVTGRADGSAVAALVRERLG